MSAPFWLVALRLSTEVRSLRAQLVDAVQDRDAALFLAAARLTDVVLLERQIEFLMTTTPSDLRSMEP